MAVNGVTQRNHDPNLHLPSADGIEPGFTREAQYTFLGSAARASPAGARRLAIVLAGVPSETAHAVIDWGYCARRDRPLVPAWARIGIAPVIGGSPGEVAPISPAQRLGALWQSSHR